MDKSKLKVGDLIRFYNSFLGGIVFGVIIEYEDKLYHSKLNIWRPKDIYFLQDCGNRVLEVITSIESVEEYALDDFYDILAEIKRNNIFCVFKAE